MKANPAMNRHNRHPLKSSTMVVAIKTLFILITLVAYGDIVSGFSRSDFAPTSTTDDIDGEQCTTPGSCEANPTQVNRGSDSIEEDALPDGFEDYLNSLEVYEVHEMHRALSEIAENAGITTMMQRQVERLLISHQFPDTKSPQDPDAPTFATFGSLLDISTVYSASWGGSTEFGGKVSWVGSLFYREEILQHEGRVPCRTDLTNDYDDTVNDRSNCILGVTIEDYVSIRGSADKKHEHMELAASWDILDEGQWRTGNILELEFGSQKFDTILANGVLAAPELELQSTSNLVLEKLISLLKPGGVVFFVGIEPMAKVDGPGAIYHEILDVIDSVKSLSGELPTRNLPAAWINRNLDRLGLNVFSSTTFPADPSYDDIGETVNEGINWIDEESELSNSIKKQYKKTLQKLLYKLEGVEGPINSGESQYIIAAELPLTKDHYHRESLPKVDEPTVYEPKLRK